MYIQLVSRVTSCVEMAPVSYIQVSVHVKITEKISV
jgi:hypothetical protein